ncbi:MAG: arginine repressor [Clostridiales bacterium]|nr:arginine repressor [Clostridiales bacterium]
MKSERQSEILKIIKAGDVETQEQLLTMLEERGYRATQATISRDIKELRLVKELTRRGGYRYTVNEQRTGSAADMRLRNIFKEGVISVEYAQNIVVIRSMPGTANAVLAALDSMEIPKMLGSLAGDDTGILIMRDTVAAEEFSREVHRLLK